MHAEDVPLATIAEQAGTPVYVYSTATIERHARVFSEAVAPLGEVLVAFAVKANPNAVVLARGGQHCHARWYELENVPPRRRMVSPRGLPSRSKPRIG